MAKPVAIKPEEKFAVDYADRLILEQLTEMESVVKLGELAERLSDTGLGLAAVRALLASDSDRFAYHERRWVPAARLQGEGRPLAEVMALILNGLGGPVSTDLLIAEAARVRHTTPEAVENAVRRLAEKDANFVLLGDGRVSLATWGLVAYDEKLARVLALNGVSEDELAAAQAKLGDIDWRSKEGIASALKAAAPISLKTLGAVAFASLNSDDPLKTLMFDANAFHARALSVPGYVLSSNGVLYPEEEAKRWVSTASRVADRLTPEVELEDAAPIEVKKEDVDRLVQRILARPGTTTPATKLLEEFYEITPSNKTFPDDMANIQAALAGNTDIAWVGGDRYRKTDELPEGTDEVPEPFHFVQTDNKDEDGELVDVELTDEGLSQTLRKLLQHPLAVDVLDEDIQPAPKTMPETVRLVLRSIHRELGTFPLAQIPTGWLTTDPKVQELHLVDPQGRELQAWMNTEARLITNLFDWWFEQPVENGAVFTLTKTPRPNVLEFEWLDQPDPVVYISSARMEELRQLGLESEGKSTLDLLIEVMSHWPKGADYLTLLAEVNVVRRSTRRLIASLLSSYQCFYQRSGSPVWHFDAKKVDQGFDKSKKKFIKK
ncbi:hypothetical protein EON82_02630 [bacterium]|nr:MAG: hypothetical protein EON82_02630 [bacterium]